MRRLFSLLAVALIVAGCAGGSNPNARAIPALTNPLIVGLDTEAARNYAKAFVAVDGYEGSTLWNVAGGERAQEGEESGVVVIDPACGLRYASALMAELNGGDPVLAPAKNTGGGSSGLFHETRQEALIFIEGRGIAGGASRPSSGCDDRQWDSPERTPGYLVARLRVIEGKTGENGARSGGTWVIEGYAASGAAVNIEVAAGFPSINPYDKTRPSKVVAPDRLGRFRITDANAERILRFATVGISGTGLASGGRRIHWFRLRDIAPEWQRIATDSNCAAPYWAFWGHGIETNSDGSVVGAMGADGQPCRTDASVPIDNTLGFDANSVGPGFWIDAYAQMGIDPVTAKTAKDGKRSNGDGDNNSFGDVDWFGVNKQIAVIAASANIGCTRLGLNPVTSGRDSYWVVDEVFNIRDPQTGVVRRATSAEAKLCKERAAAGNNAVDSIIASLDPEAASAAWLIERRLRLWCGVAVYNTAKIGGWYEYSFKQFKGSNDYNPNSVAEDGAKVWNSGDNDIDGQIEIIADRTGVAGTTLFIDTSDGDLEGSGNENEVVDWLKDGRTIDDCADLLLRHRQYSGDPDGKAMAMAMAERLNGIPANMRDVGGAIASDVFGVVANNGQTARDYIYGRLGLVSGKADPFVSITEQGGFVGQIASLSEITSGAVDAITLSPSYVYSEVIDATGACEAFRDGSFLIGDLRDGYCPGSTGPTDASGARVRVMAFSTAPESLPGGTRLGYKQAPLTKITITVTDSIAGGANQSIYRSDWLPTRIVNRQSPASIDVNAGSDILSDPIGTITRGIEDWLYGIYRSTAGSWVSGLARGAAGNLIAVPAMEVYSIRFVAPDGTPIFRLSDAVVDGEDPDSAIRGTEQEALLYVFGDGSLDDSVSRNRAMGDPEATDEKARLGVGWTELTYECTARARAGTIGQPPGATESGSVVDFRSLIAVSNGGDFSVAACYQLNPIRVAYDIVRSFGLFIAIAALCFYVIRRQIGVDTGVRPVAYATRWAGAVAVIFGIDIVARILGNVVGEAIVLTNIIGTQISGGAPYSHLWLFTSYLSTVQPGEGNIIVLLVMAIPSLIGLIFAFMVNAIRYGLTVVMMIIAPVWVVAILFGRSSRAFYGAIAFLLRLYLIAILSILFLLLLFAARRFIGLEDEASGNILSAVLNIVSLVAIALVPWKLSAVLGQAVIEPLVGTLRGAINRADAIAGEDVMSALTGKKSTGNTQTEKIDAKRIGDGMANEAAKRASADGANGGSTTPGSGEPGSETGRPKSVTERLASIAGGLAAAGSKAKEILSDPAKALSDGYAKSKEAAAALPGRITSAASAAAAKMSDTAKTRLEQARSAGMARLNDGRTTATSRFAAIAAAARGETTPLGVGAAARARGLTAGTTDAAGGSAHETAIAMLGAGAPVGANAIVAPSSLNTSDYSGAQQTLFGPDAPPPIAPEASPLPVVTEFPAAPLVPGVTPPPFIPAQVVGAQMVGSQVFLPPMGPMRSPIAAGVRLGSGVLDPRVAAERAAAAGYLLRRSTSDGDFSLRAGEMMTTAAAAGSPEIAAAAAREVAAVAVASGRGASFAASIGAKDASVAALEAAALATISRANGALRAAGGALMGGMDGSRAGAVAGMAAASAAIAAVAHEPGMQLVSSSIDNRRKQEITQITNGVRPVAVGAPAARRGQQTGLARLTQVDVRKGREPGSSANVDALRRVAKSGGVATKIAAGEEEAARLEREATFSAAERKAAGLSPLEGGAAIDGIRSSNDAQRAEIIVGARAVDYEADVATRYQLQPVDTDFDAELIGAWLEVVAESSPDELLLIIEVRAATGDPIALFLLSGDYTRLIAGTSEQADAARAAMGAALRGMAGVSRDAEQRWSARLVGVRTVADARLIADEITAGAIDRDPAAMLLDAAGVADDLRALTSEGEVTVAVAMVGMMLDAAEPGAAA
jgi:hypothetical protein